MILDGQGILLGWYKKEFEAQFQSFPHQDAHCPLSLDMDTWKFLTGVLSI